MITKQGNALCVFHGYLPDGAFYQDEAKSSLEKLINLIGDDAAKAWWEANINPGMTWRQISEIVYLKVNSLECTCREDKNATCPACVALLRSQEVEG